MLHQDTITNTMHAIASEVYAELDPHWYLAGGTALALQIGHRESVDLDYFTPEQFNTQALQRQLEHIWSNREWQVDYEAANTLWCEVDGVRVSFIYRSAALLQTVQQEDVWRLAKLEDITVMKLLAICSREEYKDYFDLACLSRHTDVRDWTQWWEDVYPRQDITSWLVALGNYDTVSEIPLQIHEAYADVSVSRTIQSITKEITDYLQ